MKLREYQQEDLEQISFNYACGLNTQLVIQATGLGKTLMIASIKKEVLDPLGVKGKVVILVNRNELAEQTKEELNSVDPRLNVGVEQADSYANFDLDDIIIVSAQTVGTASFDENNNPVFKDRMLRFDPSKVACFICDETHRAAATTFRSIFMYFGAHKGFPNFRKDLLVLGFTATPNRSDNRGLEEFYETIAANRDIVWGIENKWLTDIKAYRIETQLDLDQYKISSSETEFGKDFNAKQIAKVINFPARNNLVIDNIIRYGEGLSGVVFCANVDHAKALSEVATKKGLRSGVVVASTPKDERKRLFDAHKKGLVDILMGVGVFL